jgi:hypothetical protein
MDFYDAYFDFPNLTLKLPGISLSIFKYWDGEQAIRYVCRSRDGNAIFFVFQFELIQRSKLL